MTQPSGTTGAAAGSDAREAILARIRAALGDGSAPGPAPVERDYLTRHVPEDDGLTTLLAENLADYRAHVHRCAEAEIPGLVLRLLSEHGDTSVVVPDGLPDAWLARLRPAGDAASTGIALHPDGPSVTARDLDAVDAVVTGCALAIAETGTIVLDAGSGQGRRMLTLVPDHHICLVRVPDQVVASIPLALPRLDPGRPQTWIAGPSATSDIELDRVEGVHGPRHLDVILAG